jgi:D-alanyl-D-alanine carboxypeptidase/D-alanyl-D-alanine-endopeptidase (penicillin-binding protein 4)
LAAYAATPQNLLFSVQADTRLTPASTLKLLTTAAALETWGPHHRFETQLYSSALPDEKGILNGNLYLRGGADPTLGSTRAVGGEKWEEVAKKWAKSVKKAGITRVEGDLVADISLFEGPSISPKVNWENMGNYYAAPASPLCFNDNSFEIHFKPQPFAGKPAEIAGSKPEISNLILTSFVTTDGKSKKDNAYAYGAPGQYEIKIFGTIPTNFLGFTIKGALPDPALFALQALRESLREEGIAVGGESVTTQTAPDYTVLHLLHTYYSPELKDIVWVVNRRSFNLYADMLLRGLAVQAGKRGSLENGLTELNKFIQKNKLAEKNDTVLYDGSGLSRDNLLTPRTLFNTLVFMTKSPHFSYYYDSLATPNDRGDLLLLRRFLKPLKKVETVRVKGGTIDSVKAAAGYVKNKNGELIAFVLMANNLATKDEAILRIHEDILKQLLLLEE